MSLRRLRSSHVGLALLLLIGLMLAGCGGSDSSASSATPDKPVNLTFWNFNNLQQSTVDAFNKSHPLIHVTMNVIPAAQLYPKLEAAIKAGNAPDITRVEYQMLPTIEATGGLVDISQFGVGSLKDQFVPWTWNQVTRGNAIYALPMDTGPMALAYRTDIFQKYHLSAPKTWDEFAQDAATLHAADPSLYITDFPSNNAAWMEALAWQAGGRWFSPASDAWKVSINDAGTLKVANYWQKLIDSHIVATDSDASPVFSQNQINGKLATVLTPAWNTKYIASGAPQNSGKWGLAPLPQWVAGQQVSANMGGSTNAVTTSSKYPEQAAEFVKWISTNSQALTEQVNTQKIFPSTNAGLALNPLHSLDTYYKQNIVDVFKTASEHIDTSFTWGPSMLQTNSDYGDMTKDVISGKETLASLLNSLQTKTVSSLQQQGFSVQK
ncbi:sugar ABC transporter substrate-binding protein [Ktedonobacter sp. SOSP1-52]|uniref:ABC transporter substrate-binding protein n=1 Tax=Ktedonobacter sp. SOSP1-52 TaxID=2778366 RepID=UPI0019156451|nr:sugar ABC transporter substrate-binding protein [Ktedonobacter sp. SOSP1-52]GHO62047.1 sugar ABC transporter substrate-binding protein [Ktedonobacter sp. SOSP1-52]